MNVWLRQHRFMRPDAGRYLRPDIERYRALERKWDGQPRIEGDGPERGRFTFGTQDGEAQSDSDRPRVYIETPRDEDAEGEGSDDDGGNELDGFLIAASASSSYPSNGGTLTSRSTGNSRDQAAEKLRPKCICTHRSPVD